jgi:RNase adaptor protein for sRNA GlmZ degradation
MRFGTKDIIVTATFTASSQADIALLQTITEAGKTHNISVELIHLTAKKHILMERVQQESRRGTGKMNDPQVLDQFMAQNDVEKPLPDIPSITINTTHLTAPEVAQQILRNISAH